MSVASVREQAAAIVMGDLEGELSLSRLARERAPAAGKKRRLEDAEAGQDLSPQSKKPKSSEPTTISPQKRVDEFPGEGFEVSDGSLRSSYYSQSIFH
jgi:hypothetical protein